MAEERRVVTVLFADVAGSTALGDALDPEDVRVLLRRYYDVAREIVSEHGGILEKFIGDAVVAVFGFPHTHDDDPQRALAAALTLRDRVRDDRRGARQGPADPGPGIARAGRRPPRRLAHAVDRSCGRLAAVGVGCAARPSRVAAVPGQRHRAGWGGEDEAARRVPRTPAIDRAAGHRRDRPVFAIWAAAHLLAAARRPLPPDRCAG